MPDGLGLADVDLYAAPISVSAYLYGLEAYLERMIAFGATDRETARRWFSQALTTLGYESYTGYTAGVDKDTRFINIGGMGEAIPPTIAGVVPPLPVDVSAYALPFYKEIIAPSAFIKDAERRAISYGYEPGGAKWNALIVQAKQAGVALQYEFIQTNIQYQEDIAKAAGRWTEAKRIEKQRREAEAWWLTQQHEAALEYFATEKATTEALERKEAWTREAVLRERPGEYEPTIPAIPTGKKVVEEFLETQPGALREFIRGRLPDVLQEMEGARRAWWSALQRPARASYEERLAEAESEAERWREIYVGGVKKGMAPELRQLAVEKGAPLTQQDLTPEQYYFSIAGKRMTAAQQEAERLRGRVGERRERPERRVTEDPLKRYLAEYPWTAEFMKLSPAQRGFRPSMYAPAARWFV